MFALVQMELNKYYCKTYCRGCQDKALCRSPRSGRDHQAFEDCTVGPPRHVEMNPPSMKWLWIHPRVPSSPPCCLRSTPNDTYCQEKLAT